MAKFIRRRGRKYAKKPRRRIGRRPIRKLRYPDGLNVKLQHNDAVLSSTWSGTTAGNPVALGSGTTTLAYPGAVIQDVQFTDITGAMLFRLGDALQWNQFKTMYDRVKLNGVKVQFIPQWNIGYADSVTLGTTALLPTMKIVHDFDDSTPAPSINSIWARRGRVFRLNKPFSVFIKPRMRSAVWSAPQGQGLSGLIQAASVKSTFLDVLQAPDVAHYGLKFGIKDWNANANMRLQIVTTYYVSFKNMLYNGAPPKGELVSEEHDLLAEEGTPCEDEVVSLKV